MVLKERAYTSALITIFTLAILLASGPAEAVRLDISGLPQNAAIGDIITFTFHIDIDTGERIPLEEIILAIDGTGCAYSINGTLSPSSPQICSTFTLTPTSLSSYTYGYGYANDNSTSHQHHFGYGYGYIQPGMAYGIAWDTKAYNAGLHTINISAKAKNYTYSTKTAITLTTPPSSGSYSKKSGSSKTSTTTIQIEQPPMLEIRSIQYPLVMHPSVEESIIVTIKNTGNKPYDVSVALDITGAETQNIAPGEESRYAFTMTPGPADIGIRTAKITVSSGAATIERKITFEVQEQDIPTEDRKEKKDPLLGYDDKKELLTVEGCLNGSAKDLTVTIDSRMDIAFMLDKDNCFYIALSTASLGPGIHSLAISGTEGTIYEQSFTIPANAAEIQNTPTGNIIERYLTPSGAKIALMLSILIISYALIRYIIKRRRERQLIG
ncbi:MAG: hypothetical protein ABIG84_06135 [archaeon]